ncbi:MAG: hypothetical protein AAGA62_06615, partial [Bacteroidota bacterium]
AIPTPSDETTIPHWLHLLSTAAGHTTATGGQYGFLPQHANVPPIAQWGYDIVPGVWESDTEAFSAADVNTILLTAGNFMQWQGPAEEYPGDPGITPINATETIFNWVNQQEDNVDYFIYENWPDMAPYLGSGMPPSPAEFANYNAYTLGDFHDWWLAYQDALLASLPELNPRMIPVGPTITKLLQDPTLSLDDIPLLELYEDDAPHGRASLYFLAALVTYPALFGEPSPAGFVPPIIVHPDIRAAYADINTFIWSELQAFTDAEGKSRVFTARALPTALRSFTATAAASSITLDWQTGEEAGTNRFVVERAVGDGTFTELGSVDATGSQSTYSFTDTDPLTGENTYRLRIIDLDGQESFSSLVSASTSGTTSVSVIALGARRFRLEGAPAGTNYSLINMTGQQLYSAQLEQRGTTLQLPESLPNGLYLLVSRLPSGRLFGEKVFLGE